MHVWCYQTCMSGSTTRACLVRIAQIQLLMTKDNNGINHTDSQEHRSLVDSMAPFLDNGKPKLGIFWSKVCCSPHPCAVKMQK